MKTKKEKYIGLFTINSGEDVLTMIKRDNYLIAGGSTNYGLIEEFKFKIETNFSLDENLQTFIEEIEETTQTQE
jgi:hypothetical protein